MVLGTRRPTDQFHALLGSATADNQRRFRSRPHLRVLRLYGMEHRHLHDGRI